MDRITDLAANLSGQITSLERCTVDRLRRGAVNVGAHLVAKGGRFLLSLARILMDLFEEVIPLLLEFWLIDVHRVKLASKNLSPHTLLQQLIALVEDIECEQAKD